MASFAPAPARASAMARPISRRAPVTKAVRLVRRKRSNGFDMGTPNEATSPRSLAHRVDVVGDAEAVELDLADAEARQAVEPEILRMRGVEARKGAHARRAGRRLESHGPLVPVFAKIGGTVEGDVDQRAVMRLEDASHIDYPDAVAPHVQPIAPGGTNLADELRSGELAAGNVEVEPDAVRHR